MEHTHEWTAELYKELAEKITTAIPSVLWVDLWRNQVGFLAEEDPFPTPSIFFAFRSNNMQDLSQKIQTVTLQVDCYLFFETMASSFNKSYNQDAALNFLKTIDQLQKEFHGSTGKNYTSMRRVAFNQEESGNNGNLYRITFECLCNDYSAFVEPGTGTFADVGVNKFEITD
jgi:hypothetical protein